MTGNAPLMLERQTMARSWTAPAAIDELVIAGWTGRDSAALEAHIAELEAIGVPRPSRTPIFYRVAASLLTTATDIQIPGTSSSGEVEAVLLSLDDGLWVGVGSDHTDREAERFGVTLSKQLCAKPLAARIWAYEEVADHWDELLIRSYAIDGTDRQLYQEGSVSHMRHPAELISRYQAGENSLPAGTAMFAGTLAVIGDIRASESFAIELEDPVRRRKIAHRYSVRCLPVEE